MYHKRQRGEETQAVNPRDGSNVQWPQSETMWCSLKEQQAQVCRYMGRNPYHPRRSMKTHGWALCGDIHRWEDADADSQTWIWYNPLMPELGSSWRTRVRWGPSVRLSLSRWAATFVTLVWYILYCCHSYLCYFESHLFSHQFLAFSPNPLSFLITYVL